MKSYLPDLNVSKILLDSAHDALALYLYFNRHGITPFIDLNDKRGRPPSFDGDVILGKDGVPRCRDGLKMHRDGTDYTKQRIKFRCPLMKHGICECNNPCSTSTYGRTVYLAVKDNPRLINAPARGSDAWKTEYNKRTSAERINKQAKNDFLLENGRHRSSKIWYCRLYCIMMCQHLDAWDLPYESELSALLRRSA